MRGTWSTNARVATVLVGGFFAFTLVAQTSNEAASASPVTSDSSPVTVKRDSQAELKGIEDSTQQYETRTQEIPKQIEEAKRSILQLQDSKTDLPAELEQGSIEDLKKLGERIDKELAKWQSRLTELTAAESRRADRLVSIPGELTALTQQAPTGDSAAAGATTTSTANLPPSQTKSALHQARKDLLQAEQSFYRAEAPLLDLQQQEARLSQAKELGQKEALAPQLRKKLAGETMAVADRLRAESKSVASSPPLAAFAAETVELFSQSREGSNFLLEKQKVEASIESERQRLETIKTRMASSRRKVELIESSGLSIDAATGALFKAHAAGLPSAREIHRGLSAGTQRSAELQLNALELEASERTLIDPAQTAALRAEATAAGLATSVADDLLSNRRTIVAQLIAGQRALAGEYATLNTLRRQLAEQSETCRLFLRERLLWIRSSPAYGIGPLKKDIETTAALPTHFQKAGEFLVKDFQRSPLLWVAGIGMFLLLFLRRGRLIDRIHKLGSVASKDWCGKFHPTAVTVVLTAVLALFSAFLPLFLGWRMVGSDEHAIGAALLELAVFLLCSGFLLHASMPSGLVEKHFGWSGNKRIYQATRWLRPAMVLPIFLLGTLFHLTPHGTLGRLWFLALLLVGLPYIWAVLRPSVSPASSPWFCRALFLIAVLIPIGLVAFALAGYFESAMNLRRQVQISVWIILGILLFRALLTRVLTVSKRQESSRQLRRRREALIAERRSRVLDTPATGSGESDPPKEQVPTIEELQADAVHLSRIEGQTLQVIRVISVLAIAVSLAVVWSRDLPALSALDNITLWEEQTSIPATTGTLPLPDSITGLGQDGSSATTNGGVREVSLQDLLLAFGGLGLTIALATSLPGLVEILALRRLKLGTGSSFAITTVLRYIIVITGILLSFKLIAFNWQHLQWIAAAATLGIGFGLQEIFANFVSGLILLFERPVRLGDYVTIGGVSGRVSQIRMRATTILQFNHRELIIPNRELVTGQFVNWSLSDSVLRLEIPVGIAYGSDTKLAMNTLLSVAEKEDLVRADPPPKAVFLAFGDSTLNFELRVFLGGIDDLVNTQNKLHFEIDRRFREEGIEISFPQRDLHIRSLPPGVLGAVSPPAETPPPSPPATSV